ncbi:DUF6183 family protein [Streptomyces sp. Da 82-17]|uniref:DUF6183 family protein n=1 Tax=Streptomyces sp. Da 82-17 TaxID=3377116 RepID=UPI0038D4EB79
MREVLDGLPEARDVNPVYAVVDEAHARGDVQFLGQLGCALGELWGPERQSWPYRSVFDHVLRRLATTPGRENVVQALRLVALPKVARRGLDRTTASMLASEQPPEHLAAAFTERASEELRACLVHELVLRGVPVAGIPRIAAWATSRHWLHHPLRRLPLTRSDLEAHADLPRHGATGSSWGMPYGPAKEGRVLAAARTTDARGAADAVAAVETTTEAVERGVGAAVRNWTEESNGRVEAREFLFDEPLAEAAVPAALRSLGLDCLAAHEGRRPALTVTAVPPDHAWRVLFAAASQGGAYNYGGWGAYGRLDAWRSLAALAGVPETAGFEETEARVRASTWYAFESDAPWFEQVAWDLGLLAHTDDGHRLTVLAATDTD